MKKNLLYISLFCGLLCFNAACSDEDDPIIQPDDSGQTNTDGKPVTTSLAWEEIEKTVAILYNKKEENIPVKLQVARSGNTVTEAVTAKATALTADELAAYNTANSTSYTLLPTDCYAPCTDVTVENDGMGKTMVATLNSTKITGLSNLSSTQYVLPIRLSSADCEVKSGADIVIIKLAIGTTPVFTLGKEGNVGEVQSIVAGLSDDITTEIPVCLNVENRWASSVKFITDETALAKLVTAYGTNATLLPADYYTIGTDGALAFTADDNKTKNVTVTVKSSADGTTPLDESKTYIVPVALASCEGMPFAVDETKVAYLRYTVTDPELTLTATDGTDIEVVNNESATATLKLTLNTTYAGEAFDVEFEVDNDAAQGQTVLDSKYYTLNSVSFTGGTEITFDITFNRTNGNNKLTDGVYVLPVKVKTVGNSAIPVPTKTIMLNITSKEVLYLQTLTGSMLSTNNYENSPWTVLLVTNLIDNIYWGKNDDNFWSGAWNWKTPDGDDIIDKSEHYNATYGIYVDINISTLSLTTAARIVIHSTNKDEGRNPKSLDLYTSSNESGDNWTKAGSVTDAPSTYKNIIGNSNKDGVSNPTTISVQEITTPNINVTSSTKRIRIAFIKNQSNKDLRTDQTSTVRADELYLYGY